jgi:hypothetical protein
MLILQKSWISFLIFLSLLFVVIFSITELKSIMPCLYFVTNSGLKLFSHLPAPILTCCSRMGKRLSLINGAHFYMYTSLKIT